MERQRGPPRDTATDVAGSNLDAASGIKDPILRIAAQHVLEQHARDQADPLAQYRIPDDEWAAVAEPRTEITRVMRAIARELEAE